MLSVLFFTLATAVADVAPVDCTLLPVDRNGETGYVDITGRLVIPARFDDGGTFTQGLAAVRVEKKVVLSPASVE
jgi:hypothetical protein